VIRILNAEPLHYSAAAIDMLRTVGEIDLIDLSRTELIEILPNYDILIVRLRIQVDREVIDAGSRLRAIVTATTGLDHIDVDYAESCGIKVLSLHGQTDFLRTIPATAEHTWTLLLALVRRVPWAFQSVLNNHWERDLFRGNDLWNKGLGLVGLGRIGEKVAQYGVAFGMHVAAYDPYREEWPANVTRFKALEDMLQHTNVLSIHVPLNPETEHLIGHKELSSLRDPSWLVNTSRGGIVDEAALIEALKSGQIRGAALDVISDERTREKGQCHPLIVYAHEHDNLLITPHIGGATLESMAMTEVYMARQLQSFLETNREDHIAED